MELKSQYGRFQLQNAFANIVCKILTILFRPASMNFSRWRWQFMISMHIKNLCTMLFKATVNPLYMLYIEHLQSIPPTNTFITGDTGFIMATTHIYQLYIAFVNYWRLLCSMNGSVDMLPIDKWNVEYHQSSHIRRTEFQNLNAFLVLLSLEERYSWSNSDRRCSNYIRVISRYIAYWAASYFLHLTVIAVPFVTSYSRRWNVKSDYFMWSYVNVVINLPAPISAAYIHHLTGSAMVQVMASRLFGVKSYCQRIKEIYIIVTYPFHRLTFNEGGPLPTKVNFSVPTHIKLMVFIGFSLQNATNRVDWLA